MKRKPIVLKQDYTPDPSQDEANDAPSETLPNESLSLRELLVRYAKGIPMDAKTMRNPIYDPEPSLDGEDMEKMKHADLYEKEEYMNSLGASLAERHAKDKEAKKAKDQAEAELRQKQEAEFKEFQIWKQSQGQPPENQGGVTQH